MSPMDYIDQHYPVMYRYATKLTRNAQSAHDVVVDAIFSVANRDMSNVVHWKSYLNKTVYFSYLSRKRRNRNKGGLLEIEALLGDDRADSNLTYELLDALTAPANQEHSAILKDTYRDLTPLMRDVYFTGKTTAEIAKERKMPEQRVKAVLQKEQTEWKKSNAFRADRD